MRDRFSIKENNKAQIIKDFKSIKFACIRCGSLDIETTAVEPYDDGKHRFYVKILDQGIRNTDVYFDNMLE